MNKATYLAVLESSIDGYGVFFPDLDGCVSFGRTIEEAQKNAKEALELHIYGMERDGEELPVPSKNLDKDVVGNGIVVVVSVFLNTTGSATGDKQQASGSTANQLSVSTETLSHSK